ncbi:MAG TPA: trypsin-like peptidase domain-containing protein [Chloroflexota bacterium]|nr:trypsin-like peptidase domain-containing protein [Chloroflexota bacterium]
MITSGSRIGLALIAGALVLPVAGCAAAINASTTPTATPVRKATPRATVARKSTPVVTRKSTTVTSGQSSSTASVVDAFDAATESASAAVSPKVVLIQSAAGLGSGEIVDARGYIVTNYHVLSGGGQSLQPPFHVIMSDGKSYPASVAGTDAADDLAVLKISAGQLKPIAFGDSNKLRVGEFVLAVGNPLGYQQTVTFGIISTLGRGLPEGQPAAFLPNLIQTSAPINPGNSGGALVDLYGRLVGIPTLAAQDPQQGTAAQGIGFAIPVNRVRYVVGQIITYGKVVNSGRAFLGISALDITPDVQAQYGLPVAQGVLIYGTSPQGPAAKAGLKRGDIIVAINGRPVTSSADLLDTVSSLKPGQKATLQVVGANGKKRTITITLGVLPVPSVR